MNGVRHFVEALDRSDRDLRDLRAKICAIGPATRAAVEALHLRVDVMPGRIRGGEFAARRSQGEDLKGKRILLPRAAVARDVVPVTLRERGAQVDVVEAYRTIIPADAASARERSAGAQARLDHVHQFVHGEEPAGGDGQGSAGRNQGSLDWSGDFGDRARAGLTVDVEAEPHTIEGLVEAIVRNTRFPLSHVSENFHAAGVHAEANQVGARAGLQAAQASGDAADARGIGGRHGDGVRETHSGARHDVADGAIHAQAGAGQAIAAAQRDAVVIAQFDGDAAQHVGSRRAQSGSDGVGHQDAAVGSFRSRARRRKSSGR